MVRASFIAKSSMVKLDAIIPVLILCLWVLPSGWAKKTLAPTQLRDLSEEPSVQATAMLSFESKFMVSIPFCLRTLGFSFLELGCNRFNQNLVFPDGIFGMLDSGR
ncbi:hypothetical protein NPIL_619311 [Nephila pilipes]|uniref:Uncharacterized protein n=1 Tax=Nephila pilipes TaxID=299642 RepID=A0A8X6PD66_NEPPI|nr:hypothetical protein NPIL_619311 [Nephila pilipes]